MATDSKGATSTWSGILAVSITGSDANQAPYAPYTPWGSTAGKSGNSYEYSVYAIDPDGDRVKYTFDWGDGTTSTTALVSSGTEASASHKWSVPPNTQKTFNVRAMATDERGKTSDWSIARVVIMVGPRINYPPTTASTPVGPTSGVTGTTYSYTTSATDPDGDTIQYIFCWVDETITTGFYPSGAVVTASHSWNNAGVFDVRVIAVDSHGQSAEEIWEAPLRVTIKGPSINAQELGLEVEELELVDTPTEEPVLGSFSNDFNYSSIDAQTEENESIDAQTEDGASDTQTEDEALDTQTGEDCPVAEDDEYLLTSESGVLEISAPGLLDNDQCGTDNSLSVKSYTQPTHAANFALNADGSFTYTRSQDCCGEDSFTYIATDGFCESNEATVTIYADCKRQNEGEEVVEPVVEEVKS
jgi:hypothetical protein